MALYTPLSPMPKMVTQPFEAAPRIFGALIGAGASLIGGALNRKSSGKQESRANAHNDPAAIRDRYEAAGFDPLLGINNANPSYQQTYQPKFGSAVANAVNGFINKKEDAKILDLEKTRLELEVDKLRKDVKGAKIRPKVAGVFNGGFTGGVSADNSNNTNIGDNIPPNAVPREANGDISNRDLVFNNQRLDVDEKTSPVQNVEDEYGEIAGELFGAAHLTKDFGRAFVRDSKSTLRLMNKHRLLKKNRKAQEFRPKLTNPQFRRNHFGFN